MCVCRILSRTICLLKYTKIWSILRHRQIQPFLQNAYISQIQNNTSPVYSYYNGVLTFSFLVSLFVVEITCIMDFRIETVFIECQRIILWEYVKFSPFIFCFYNIFKTDSTYLSLIYQKDATFLNKMLAWYSLLL